MYSHKHADNLFSCFFRRLYMFMDDERTDLNINDFLKNLKKLLACL